MLKHEQGLAVCYNNCRNHYKLSIQPYGLWKCWIFF